MNLLLAHHGLDPDTNTDQDVANSIAQSMTEDEAADLENRARSGDIARKELVDADLARYGARIGQSPAAQNYWRDALLANRAAARAALEALPEAGRPRLARLSRLISLRKIQTRLLKPALSPFGIEQMHYCAKTQN